MRPWAFPPLLVCCLVACLAAAAGDRSAQAPGAPYHESIASTLVRFEMVPVPAGSVVIEEPGGSRTMDVAAFFIGRTEVTWDMFDVFMLRLDSPGTSSEADAVARPSEPYGAPDRGWGHAGFPAMSVTSGAAEMFCRWLSARTGRTYRLPTEAEWTRAAVLASGGAPLSGARRDALAWHQGNAGGTTHPVGKRQPDGLGLFDLFGNVAEWVTTTAGPAVARGGAYTRELGEAGPQGRAVQEPAWNQTDPQLPKSRWWLSDGPFVGFRLVSTGVRESVPAALNKEGSNP